MRNLRLAHSLRVGDASELSSASHLSIDYDTGFVYTATAHGVTVLDPSTQQVVGGVDLRTDGYVTEDVSVVGLQHLPDQMSVAIATSAGDVLLWSPTSPQVECVGSVESGIVAMGWSPDHEVVVLATGQATLIMMTREFDPVTEVPMEPQEFGEAQPINVGWGKKETQFHGSIGKDAAKQQKENVKPALPWDDRQTRISWRGDGQMFVVSNIEDSTGARRIRTWSRECVLHSTSEDVAGLEQALAWKPSGSLIVSSQRRPNKHDIVFFEQNGLRHGEFTLPYKFNEVKVREVLWNIESTVLVVWCEDLPPEGQSGNFYPKSYVDLWTVNNYHWYQKQHLEFPGEVGKSVCAVAWDPEQAYRLHIINTDGQYLQYTWAWGTDVSLGHTQDDLATVAVIDGCKVLLTPFRQMVVPPPMCAYYLELPAPVSQVAFGPSACSNRLAVLLSDGRVAVYTHTKEASSEGNDSVKVDAAGGNGFVVRCGLPKRQGIYSVEDDATVGYPSQRYHLTWLNEETFVYSSLDVMGSQSMLCKAVVANDKLQMQEQLEIGGYQYSSALHPGTGHMLIQLTDGSLKSFVSEENKLTAFTSNGHQVKFPLPCPQMAYDVLDGQDVALGLTERFRFFVNDQEIANNVTSFCIHNEFVLLTTHTHTCRCICRSTPLKDLPSLSGDRSHPFDESIRRVERGSRIVCVVGMDTKLVLQMPRGNLETVHPRALVLSSVRRMLDNLEYSTAFTTIRKHRLNMNLMCDHNCDVFLANISTFIQQVESVNNINLFLTDLQEEDVTVTMYTGAYRPDHAASQVGNKVDTVCDAIRKILEDMDPDRYLLSILTAYVKKTRPELHTALQRIKDLQGQTDAKNHVSAEDALKYLLFLVDVNELYDVALGTYDFDLVVMVAEKSQKEIQSSWAGYGSPVMSSNDPKEYLPFLNQLRKMEENYQRYTIDRHLKRHLKALEHISKCGPDHFPECLILVNEQRLYAQAIQLYKRGSTEHQALAEAYAAYLSEKLHHQEAGLVLLKAKQLEGALEQFEKSLDWRQAICIGASLKMSEEKTAELARRLSDELKNAHRYMEAACLLEQYAKDVEEAIVTLIEGSEWQEALRLMHLYDRLDFMETNLHPSVLEAAESMCASMEAAQQEYQRYTQRLAVVRDLKEQARLELMEGGGGCNDADLFSDTSSATGASVVSGTSRATSRFTTDTNMSGRSGKSRRKAERRKWSLKEGSRNEDLALIEALHKAAVQAEDRKKDVSALLSVLVQLDYDEKAAELQQTMDSLIATVTKAIPEIWDPEQDDLGTAAILGPDSTANTIAQAVQSGRGGSVRQEVQLDAQLRVPPVVSKETRWQLHMLRSNES